MYQVDAFASRVFAGNPAAVCPLERWLPDELMQAIAAENNLSETAFLVPDGDRYAIRWFTPATEVDLCGHATLASAFVLFERDGGDRIHFDSKSGALAVAREGDLLVLDFPSRPPEPCSTAGEVVAAFGRKPVESVRAADYIAVFDSAEWIREVSPDIAALRALDSRGVIITAAGDDCDFVARFFGPNVGIDEDPVTGSAYTQLVPYWAEKTGKTQFHARQVSARGGELHCELVGDRVHIGGRAMKYLEGSIELPEDLLRP